MNMIWRSKLPITAGLLLTLVISGAFRSGTRGPDSLSEQSNSNSRTLPSPAAEPTQALLEQSSQGTDTNDSNANIMMETHRPPAVIHIPAAEAVRESDCLELVRLAKQHAEAGETHEAELYLQQARTRICDRLNVVAAQHQAVSSDDLAMLADFIQLDNDDHADMARELVQYLVSSEADSETIRRDVEALTSLELVDDVEVALLRLEKLQNINAEDTPDAFRQSLTGLQREASVFVRQPAKSVVRKALDHWELCVRQAFERANDDYKRLTLLEPLSSELGDPGVEIAVAARLIELCPLDDHSEIAKNVERIMSLHRSPADLSIAACRRLLQYSLINKEWAEADRWLKTIENRGGMSDFERDQRVALRNISFANELVQRWIGRPIPFCLTGVNEHDKRFQGDLNLILMEVVDDQLKGRAAFSMHGTIADVKGDISADGLRLVLDLAWIDPIVLTPESARSGYDRIKWSGMADNRSSRLLLSELATGKDCVFVDLPRNTFPLQYYCRESQRRGVSNQGVWFDPYQTDDLRLFFQSVPYRGTSYFSRTTFPEVKPISFDMTDLCTTSDVLVKGQMLVRSPSSRYQTLNVSFTLDASPKPFRQIPVSLIQTPKSLSFMDFGKAFGWCDIELLVKQGTRLLSVTALESVLLNGCIVQTIDVPSQ